MTSKLATVLSKLKKFNIFLNPEKAKIQNRIKQGKMPWTHNLRSWHRNKTMIKKKKN